MTQQELDMCKWNGKSSHCKHHIRYVEDKSHIKIYNMNLDTDNVHLLLSFPPDYSLSQTVNRLKQMTTNYLYRNE